MLLEYLLQKTPIEDEDFLAFVELSQSWDCELICMNYFFAQILEKRKKLGTPGLQDLIEKLYKIQEEFLVYFSVQELDDAFIDFLVRSASATGVSLEDKLIDVQTSLSEYRYDEAFHFPRI
jgi:hypothetical protein